MNSDIKLVSTKDENNYVKVSSSDKTAATAYRPTLTTRNGYIAFHKVSQSQRSQERRNNLPVVVTKPVFIDENDRD